MHQFRVTFDPVFTTIGLLLPQTRIVYVSLEPGIYVIHPFDIGRYVITTSTLSRSLDLFTSTSTVHVFSITSPFQGDRLRKLSVLRPPSGCYAF